MYENILLSILRKHWEGLAWMSGDLMDSMMFTLQGLDDVKHEWYFSWYKIIPLQELQGEGGSATPLKCPGFWPQFCCGYSGSPSKNRCFQIVVLEKTLESPLDCKEIQPVHSEGDKSWVFFGRTDTEAETPILWPPHVKSWLIGKDPDAGKDWRQEEKGATEDEMVGWHHWLNGYEFEQTLGNSGGQRGLACCSPRGYRVGHDLVSKQQKFYTVPAAVKKHQLEKLGLRRCPAGLYLSVPPRNLYS